MNTIRKESKGDIITYTLRGPLNTTLKTKLKNHASTLLNHANNPRNLSTLHLTPETSPETIEMVTHARIVKPDIKEPAVQLAVLSNNFITNIITNKHKGTYIKDKNKNKYFNNIGKLTKTARISGYFLRKGAGAKLVEHVIKEQREKGIKTIFVHPDNKALESYYAKFGFIPLSKVPKNINRPTHMYESYNFGRLMYLEL